MDVWHNPGTLRLPVIVEQVGSQVCGRFCMRFWYFSIPPACMHRPHRARDRGRKALGC